MKALNYFYLYKEEFKKTIGVLLGFFICLSYMKSDPVYPNFFYSSFHTVNLIFHEAGHTLFMFFGDFIYILGGSIFQCLVPAFLIYVFYKKKDDVGVSIMLMWLATNIYEVAVYMADAKVRILPLLGDDIDAHDWYNIFSMLNVLDSAKSIAGYFFTIANIIILFGLVYGIYYIWEPSYKNIKAELDSIYNK